MGFKHINVMSKVSHIIYVPKTWEHDTVINAVSMSSLYPANHLALCDMSAKIKKDVNE